MKYPVPRGVSSSFRLKGIFRIFFVANGEEAVSSRSRSEATIVVADKEVPQRRGGGGGAVEMV